MCKNPPQNPQYIIQKSNLYLLKIFIERRCAYGKGKKKSSLPQETSEPVQPVPGEPGRIDDHVVVAVRSVELQRKIAGYDTQIASLSAQIDAETARAEEIEEYRKYTQNEYFKHFPKSRQLLFYPSYGYPQRLMNRV